MDRREFLKNAMTLPVAAVCVGSVPIVAAASKPVVAPPSVALVGFKLRASDQLPNLGNMDVFAQIIERLKGEQGIVLERGETMDEIMITPERRDK